MSAEKHTPGPWHYEVDGPATNDMRHGILSEFTGLWIATTYRSGTSAENEKSPEADAEAIANARLIAAAPDLLEFAEEVRRTGDTRLASMAIAVIAKARA